jgi:predicted ATPase
MIPFATMLTQLRVKNFRLLREVTIDFGPLTVFIGPNASGKSTVLEVLDLLSRLSGESLEEAFDVHGGVYGIRTIGASGPLEISTRWKFNHKKRFESGKGRSWSLDWELQLDQAPNGALAVRRETLLERAAPTRTLIETSPEGVRWVHPHPLDEDGNLGEGGPPATAPPDTLAFNAVRDDQRFPALTHLRRILGEIRVLGSLTASPRWARADPAGPSARDSLIVAPAPTIGRQGAGLANVLNSVWVDHPDAWAELERAFRGEFPFIKRIVFPPDAGGSRIAFAVEDTRFPERKILASEMSDGMVTYLALLAAIVQPDQLGILGLDEPDATIHPSALRRLLDLAQRAHGKRRLAIVTHSNALLDELQAPAEQIRVSRVTKDGASIERLDADALAAWRSQYSVSDLRRTGVLDQPNVAYEPGQPPKTDKASTRGR